jgi:hypothetical protein
MLLKPVFFVLFVLAVALAITFSESALAQDKEGSFSILLENDSFGGSDRHYTNGLKASWLSAEDDLPQFGRWLARNLPFFSKKGRKRVGYALGHNIYTPSDISATHLQVDDRPYAGWLYGEIGLVSETGSRLDSVAISLGVIGPLSQAESVQKAWHEFFGFTRPRGWDHQLKNEPAFNIAYERKWRHLWRQTWFFGLDTDVTPHVGFSLGNVFTHGAAGFTLRLGERLESDFGGPPRIRPSQPGAAHFTPRGDFGWYLFAGVEGRAVARNIFLDGNTFTDSHSVDKKPLVGDVQFGIALIFPRFRIAYTQVLRTKQFDGQDAAHNFGALSLTTRF